MALSDILDQPIPLRLLRNALTGNRIPNAMLFWGPSGVGKKFAAYEFAKAINCRERRGDGCGECLACRKIAHGNHADVQVTIPAGKTRIIKVETIEDLVGLAVLRPFEAEWRVFIVLDAERMNPPAQNKLLKTLEEPAGKSVFLLVTEHPDHLLPTIRSRCQLVRFGGLSPNTVKSLLMRERTLDDTTAESIAGIAQGQMTRAFDTVDNDRRGIVFDFLKRAGAGEDPLALGEEFARFLGAVRDAVEASIKERAEPVDAKSLSKDDRDRLKEEQEAAVDGQVRRAILELLTMIETWFRDKLVMGATQDESRVLNRDQASWLKPSEGEELEPKLKAIEKSRIYLERNLNPERVFRDLFFSLAR